MPDSRTQPAPLLAAPPSMRMIAAWTLFVMAILVLLKSQLRGWLPYPGEGLLIALALLYGFLFPAWLVHTIRNANMRARQTEQQLVQALRNADATLERQVDTRTHSLRQEIEARKAMESFLQQALDTQSRQLAGQRDFSAMVSHELRTPLAIIDIASQSLQMLELGQSRDAALRLERIRGAVVRLAALADGLQSIERLERNIANREFSSVNLAELARKVADAFAYEHQIALEVDGTPIVAGDAGLLDIAITNLAGNAVKYAGGHGQITISVIQSDEHVRLTVRDQGPGIAETDLVHIFGRFFRSERTRHQPGAGQGLFLARRICETHSGNITARNLPNKGCEFTLTLPLASPGASG